MTEQRDSGQRRLIMVLSVLSLVLVGAAGVGTVAVMAWASGVGTPEGPADAGGGLVFLLRNLTPHALAVAVVTRSRRQPSQAAAMAVAAGCFALAVVDAWFLRSFVVSESSTAALVFITLPVILAVVVGLTQLVVWLLRRLRTRQVQPFS